MTDVRQWLEELGLSQYAAAFEENEIDLDLVCDLDDAALKDLGVAVMGHRVRLARAIAVLATPSEDANIAAAGPEAPTGFVSREADRRQITVMFCDLVGSTALSETLDPEELRELMAAYQKAAGQVIDRYDGHVAQYLGDGIMAYFGWPHAHEDDAQRAVRAGLDIVTAVDALDTQVDLSVRVGMATGPVVVGATGAGDASVPQAAVGETPNLAARIQGIAAPQTVAIGDQTRRLLGGVFELESLGMQTIKGLAMPVEVFRVVSIAARASRFEALSVSGLTPFVGRESEVAMLLDRWAQAKEGEGQVVLLEGEPGIGKSRINQVLRGQVAQESHHRLRYQCSPYHINSAFYPIIRQFDHAAGIGSDDTPDQKLDKIEAILKLSTDNVDAVAALFAKLLSLHSDRYPQLDLSPDEQKDKIVETFVNQVDGMARTRPVLMILEDAHWVDPTTLDVFSNVIEQIAERPVLLVITFRPEFEPPWPAGGNVTAHTLTRLSRRLGADIVAKITGGKALPDEVQDQIIANSPLIKWLCWLSLPDDEWGDECRLAAS